MKNLLFLLALAPLILVGCSPNTAQNEANINSLKQAGAAADRVITDKANDPEAVEAALEAEAEALAETEASVEADIEAIEDLDL